MLSIGEFSKICKVSAKTLRYYAEIGLVLPEEINPENGYRYYSIKQLETMLFISRLKSYRFSLEEIKEIINLHESEDERLFIALNKKKNQLEDQAEELNRTLCQLKNDIINVKHGKSIMSYMDSIDVQLVEIPMMRLLSIRKMVHEFEFKEEYGKSFGELFRSITEHKLTALAPPMVLFHSEEFNLLGMDTEFAVPIKDKVTGTRDFSPGLCLKTILHGSYSNLPSIYARQREWAEKEGYKSSDALYEVYVTDPSQVSSEQSLVTEIYYPIKKKG